MRTAVEGRRQSWRVWWILLGVVLVAGAWGMDASAQDEEFPPSADVVPPVEDAVPAENGAPQPDTPAPAPLEPGPQEPQEMVQEEEAPPPPPPPPPTPARTGSFSSPSSRPVVAPPARGRSFPRGASAPKPAGPAVPPPPERKEVPNDQKPAKPHPRTRWSILISGMPR
ncbi:MAG TPA: hypothetical protein PLX03_04605 [Candidatus Hydrogenedentes bacterium]|nr:hypothetical protein [Candidatus Hydrogenedentota bacterium]